MGKNFSRNQKRENRNEADFYQTPHCLTRAFIDYAFIKDNLFDISYKTDFSIADFCCGKKAIGDVIKSYSITDNKEDLKLIETDLSEGVDFFSLSKEEIKNLCFGRLPDIGIMNPPFKLFNKWVEKCFEILARNKNLSIALIESEYKSKGRDLELEIARALGLEIKTVDEWVEARK